MSDTIKVGDVVTYRGGFGRHVPKKAVVTDLTVTKEPREKDGLDCKSVSVSLVKANRVVFNLDDGHWCYSDQIDL